MLVDTHCHLTDPAFDPDRREVIRAAAAAGVGAVVTIASSVEDSRAGRALAREHPGVWCTAGIHPHEAGSWSPEAMETLRGIALGHSRVVALGETGLDHHYDLGPRRLQLRSFEDHLALGVELGLPVVVHCRSAEREVEAVIRAAPAGSRGVLHCFAGDARLLEAALDRGWSVSVGGIVTFRSYDGADLLRTVPTDRLMLETDSPYLTPVPFRGKRNEPSRVTLVRDAVAAHLGMTPAEVEERTTRNAAAFFRLELPDAAGSGGTGGASGSPGGGSEREEEPRGGGDR